MYTSRPNIRRVVTELHQNHSHAQTLRLPFSSRFLFYIAPFSSRYAAWPHCTFGQPGASLFSWRSNHVATPPQFATSHSAIQVAALGWRCNITFGDTDQRPSHGEHSFMSYQGPWPLRGAGAVKQFLTQRPWATTCAPDHPPRVGHPHCTAKKGVKVALLHVSPGVGCIWMDSPCMHEEMMLHRGPASPPGRCSCTPPSTVSPANAASYESLTDDPACALSVGRTVCKGSMHLGVAAPAFRQITSAS